MIGCCVLGKSNSQLDQVRAFKDETQRVEKELAASPTTRAYVVTDETERLSSPEG